MLLFNLAAQLLTRRERDFSCFSRLCSCSRLANTAHSDVVVEPIGADGKSLSTNVPALVVEVLSKTSRQRDLGAKPVEYTSLDSMHAYIVASQDGPECWIWARGADRTFPVEAERVAGRDKMVAVP